MILTRYLRKIMYAPIKLLSYVFGYDSLFGNIELTDKDKRKFQSGLADIIKRNFNVRFCRNGIILEKKNLEGVIA